jgi:hypothetical protein
MPTYGAVVSLESVRDFSPRLRVFAVNPFGCVDMLLKKLAFAQLLRTIAV